MRVTYFFLFLFTLIACQAPRADYAALAQQAQDDVDIFFQYSQEDFSGWGRIDSLQDSLPEVRARNAAYILAAIHAFKAIDHTQAYPNVLTSKLDRNWQLYPEHEDLFFHLALESPYQLTCMDMLLHAPHDNVLAQEIIEALIASPTEDALLLERAFQKARLEKWPIAVPAVYHQHPNAQIRRAARKLAESQGHDWPAYDEKLAFESDLVQNFLRKCMKKIPSEVHIDSPLQLVSFYPINDIEEDEASSDCINCLVGWKISENDSLIQFLSMAGQLLDFQANHIEPSWGIWWQSRNLAGYFCWVRAFDAYTSTSLKTVFTEKNFEEVDQLLMANFSPHKNIQAKSYNPIDNFIWGLLHFTGGNTERAMEILMPILHTENIFPIDQLQIIRSVKQPTYLSAWGQRLI